MKYRYLISYAQDSDRFRWGVIRMKYEYLIIYAHNSGFGNCSVTLEQKIDSYELILQIAKKITKDFNFSNQVVILNFILLRELAE